MAKSKEVPRTFWLVPSVRSRVQRFRPCTPSSTCVEFPRNLIKINELQGNKTPEAFDERRLRRPRPEAMVKGLGLSNGFPDLKNHSGMAKPLKFLMSSPRRMASLGSRMVANNVVSSMTKCFLAAWHLVSARAARTWISLHLNRQARSKVNCEAETSAS